MNGMSSNPSKCRTDDWSGASRLHSDISLYVRYKLVKGKTEDCRRPETSCTTWEGIEVKGSKHKGKRGKEGSAKSGKGMAWVFGDTEILRVLSIC